MKVIEREIKRELAAAAAPILWNYWDHEHLYVVHKNYTSAYVLYDDHKIAIYLLTFKLPVVSFMTSQSLNVMVQVDDNTIKAYNVGLFNMPFCTTITVKEVRKDFCEITMNYRVILRGWTEILAPFLPKMIDKWNEQVWLEDLPIKERRQKVLRMGFKDFVGLPSDVENRVYDGHMPFELPITRHNKSPVNFPFDELSGRKP